MPARFLPFQTKRQTEQGQGREGGPERGLFLVLGPAGTALSAWNLLAGRFWAPAGLPIFEGVLNQPAIWDFLKG